MDSSDKHRSKSGRYVGGFLQLFDWNAKSRKKLFSSKSPEDSKQGKKAMGNLPMARMLVDEDEDFGGVFGAGLSVRGGSDYSCASSVTDEDGYGTKAPGVVARLMGLDSLPTSHAMDLYSTPYFDCISIREAPLRGRNIDLYHNHQMTHSSDLHDKMERATRNNELESRSQKLPNRPIEKFQTEILPPKSAKTIPITHHKLLSPIKSPIFVPSQDAAHIMEAASRILEPGPSATPRAKISSSGSSSATLKVREMREKLEAAQRPAKASETLQRPIESNSGKNLKTHSANKSWNGLGETTSFRVSPSREDSSSLKNKGKSVSLAIQAKVNVQKREKSLTSSNRSVGDLEEMDDNKSTQLSRNQASAPKFSNRRPVNQNNSVLKQNNQKQNCPPLHRERSDLKASDTSTTNGKKPMSEDTSSSRLKSVAKEPGTSRTSSRKSSLHARDDDKEIPYGRGKKVPRKKRSEDGSLQIKKNQVTENMSITSKHGNPSHSSLSADKQLTWIEESRRKGLDVVSFTFTAPITRSQPGFEHSRQLAEKCSSDEGSKMFSDSDLTWLSSPGLNGIKGDALSKLLEQKLKELASNLETSDPTFGKSGITTDSDQQFEAPGSTDSDTGKSREKLPHDEPLVVDMNRNIYSGIFANEAEQFNRTFNFQAGGAMDKYCSDNAEANKYNCHLPSPVSILEPSVLTESCCSSESIASSITEESKPCSSVHAQETEISGSVSSASSQVATDKISMKSTAWELCYVKDILCNVELMFMDYVAGRTREIVNPHLFDQMERKREFGKDELKLERKMLFDCVGECMNLKCQRFIGGGFDMWTKGMAMLKRKERLAEEVYKEIQVWRDLENSMVDELVDKDMSSKCGRWLDFEVDGFVLGVEIEGQILDSLVGEIVSDIISKQ